MKYEITGVAGNSFYMMIEAEDESQALHIAEAAYLSEGDPLSVAGVIECEFDIEADHRIELQPVDVSLENLTAELLELKWSVVDYANHYTHGAFVHEMTYEKALKCLDAPGWGLPEDIRETVSEIKRIEEHLPIAALAENGREWAGAQQISESEKEREMER